MTEKPLRQRIDIMLVALFANTDSGDMDNHRLMMELIDNTIALPSCTNGVITSEFLEERLPALLRLMREIINAPNNRFTHPHVGDRAKLCPRYRGKYDLPYETHASSSALTVSQGIVSPRVSSWALRRNAAISSGSPRISSVSVIDS